MVSDLYAQSDVINTLTELALENKWVFRGYSKQDQLLPNIIRQNMVQGEKELLFLFERYGSQYLNINNPIDLMSYAQHFGLPTRLLDFTYNPFIALFFSIFSPKSTGNYKEPSDKEFYYIRIASVPDNIILHHIPYYDKEPFFEINSYAQRSVSLIETIQEMFSLETEKDKPYYLGGRENMINGFFKTIALETGIENVDEYTNENKSKVKKQTILFVDPSQSNQRLVMQQGLFMFPYSLDETDHLRILDENTKIIRVHKSLREELFIYLDTLGINSFRIMPDLSNVCEGIKRKVKDKK